MQRFALATSEPNVRKTKPTTTRSTTTIPGRGYEATVEVHRDLGEVKDTITIRVEGDDVDVITEAVNSITREVIVARRAAERDGVA